MRPMSLTWRFFFPLLVALLALASPARAETLRITCDNYVEQLFVDGTALTLGPNSNNWTTPDNYVVDLAPGAHSIAFRASDDGASTAGCMIVLLGDDGTTVLGGSVTNLLRTVRVDPGSGWETPGFDDTAWSLAAACASTSPWGGSIAWGTSVGATMVWGPTGCVGSELGSRRWFRWAVTVPECLDAAACNDGNDCTDDACTGGSCVRTATPTGTACGGSNVCNGSTTSPLCVACLDSSPSGLDLGCAGAAPHCRTGGAGAPRCEACIDSSSGGLDLGCGTSTPNCVASGAGSVCVACESDTQCADASECTTNACTSGMCSTIPVAFGTACSAGICDVNLDCSAVAVTLVTPAEGSTTNDATPTYSGVATPGTTVTVTVDGTNVGTAIAAADGTWSLTPTTALAAGPHTATASVTGAGRTVTDDARFTVDLSTTVAITAPANGSTIADNTPEILGTGEPGAVVVVTLDGATLGSTTVGPDGSWVLVVTSPLGNGPHTASVVATDAVGNTASSSTTFTVDASTSVSITAPISGSTTRDATPTITGTAVPGASVVVTIDGTEVGRTTAAGDGSWSVDVTTALIDGAHTAEATAMDSHGNVATDSTTFTVDTGTSLDITSADPGSVRGTGEPGATVIVTVGTRTYGAVTVAADGTWVVTLDEPLAPGTHDVTATATDGAGNTASDTATITVATGSDGGLDASMLDGGAPGNDAGRLDAGSLDAGQLDAGGADAHVTSNDDAGELAGGVSGGACGCATQTDSRPRALWLLAIGLVLGLAQRRRGRARH